jgi:hypothetical protein
MLSPVPGRHTTRITRALLVGRTRAAVSHRHLAIPTVSPVDPISDSSEVLGKVREGRLSLVHALGFFLKEDDECV